MPQFEDGAKAINQAVLRLEACIERQAEIIEKMFNSEADLANLKIGYLDEYFDHFLSRVNQVATKTSDLNDNFLIMERHAAKANRDVAATEEASSRQRRALPSNFINDRRDKSDKDAPVYNVVTEDSRKDEKPTSKVDKAGRYAKYLTNTSEANRVLTEKKENNIVGSAEVKSAVERQIDELFTAQGKKADELKAKLIDLQVAEYEFRENAELRTAKLTDIRLTKLNEAEGIALETQNKFNDMSLMLEYMAGKDIDAAGKVNEAGQARATEVNAKDRNKSMEDLEKRRIAFIEKQELASKLRNHGKLTAAEATRIQKEAALKFALEEKNLDKLTAKRTKQEALDAAAAERAQMKDDAATLMGKGVSLRDRAKAWESMTTDPETGERDNKKALAAAITAIGSLAKQLETTVDEIGSYKSFVDTRLQGSSLKTNWAGSYWDNIVKDMTSVGAVNPYFRQKDFADNIKSLIDTGIAFDLEQRAFLMTIKDKIATTFNVADASLLRLVRIQQQDSTAGRLGMEAALNAFLNNMYENTEYLKGVADNVRSSLLEMQSLMEGAEATEVEYQVQKWLGSLFSVGMSSEAVNSISNAFGQIAAGQIEGITGGGAGNLLIMAANDAGLSIADILTDGLDSKKTNELLQASVNYLAELADSAKDNKVVQQQLATVFGVKASDLRAATNLVSKGSVEAIYGNSLSYSNMLNKLYSMADTMGERTSIAEMMTNVWENGKYTIAGSMASSPISYMIYKVATLLDDTAGGIPIPDINIVGNMVGLNTTIADIMRVAALGTGILGSIGSIAKGLGNSFSGRNMLEQLGIDTGSSLKITPRGDGTNLLGSIGGGARTTSSSAYAGNASGSDIKESTLQETEDSKKQQMIEAKEEEDANHVDLLNTTVLKIYELLDDVAHGSGSFKVKVEGYGLTKAGGSGSGSGALGGVSALNSISGGNGSSAGSSMSGVNSGGVGGSIDLGGWTMI